MASGTALQIEHRPGIFHNMDSVREISVGVPDALAGEIDAAVASGDYASPSDVVGEALELWRRARDTEVARLRELVREGLDSGEPQPVPNDWAEQVIAEGKARLAATKRAGEAA